MRSVYLILSCVVALLAPAQAQSSSHWTAQLAVGADRYWGGSVEISGEHRSFRPYRPTVFGLGLERSGPSFGLGLQFRYLEAAMALEGEGAVAAVGGVFTVVSASPEILYHLATLGPAAELWLQAGPIIEHWDILDEDAQIRVGGQGGVSLSIPLGGRLSGGVLVGLSVTGSPFTDGQLGSEFDTRPLWRRRVAGALRYRL